MNEGELVDIKFLEKECWYGGAVHKGYMMPLTEESDVEMNLITAEGISDQFSPIFISNKGRYIISDKPFVVHFDKGTIKINTDYDIELGEGYETLKGAYLEVSKKKFVKSENIPNKLFFEAPQYNTWIELMYNQNQKQILEYAKTLKEAGLPTGVLMIDEGWAPDYGDYEFCARKFSDPKKMVDELHEMGFKVMLWVTPLISPDSDCYRELRNTNYLIKNSDGKLAVREWWNGFSAVLDLSNPEVCDWFDGKLQNLMDKYGVDGFKFDAGGSYLYRKDDQTYIKQEQSEHTKSFAQFGAKYEFNELRCVWDCGGMPLVCRLQDKASSWTHEEGITMIIPNMIQQGILGYFYGCPDMIGGGEYGSFLSDDYKFDEELYVRWFAASIFSPMMQISISPKRLLSEESMKIVMNFMDMRSEYLGYMMELIEKTTETQEPVMRFMEYEFPNQGMEKVTDQFMLGDRYLIAPVLEQGKNSRIVHIPEGKWKRRNGEVLDGGCACEIAAKLDELIILERL